MYINSRLVRLVPGLVQVPVGSHSVELVSDLLEGFRHTGKFGVFQLDLVCVNSEYSQEFLPMCQAKALPYSPVETAGFPGV
jgi:hypothetical protein